MGSRRRRGGGPGGSSVEYSSPEAMIIDVGIPPPSPAPALPAQNERWGTPSPPPEPLSESTKNVLTNPPCLYNLNFQYLKGAVMREFPNSSDDQVDIDHTLAVKILRNHSIVPRLPAAVRELIDYSKRNVLTPHQKIWLKGNLSFLTQHVCRQMAKRSKAEMSLCHDPNMELYCKTYDEDGDLLESLCTFCDDHHESGPECEKLIDHGPLNPTHAAVAKGWERDTGLIYIGSRETIYVPEDLGPSYSYRGICRNLGIVEWKEVTYPTGVYLISPGHHDPKFRLRNLLELRLTKACKNLTVPVLIEFFPSASAPTAPFVHHLLGFFAEVESVRSYYQGPIIVVFIMPTPHFTVKWEEYLEHKLKYLEDLKVALCLGWALGVPITCLNIFDIPVDVTPTDTWFYRAKFWKREALFGGYLLETKTREYMRRFANELGELQNALISVDYEYLSTKVFNNSPEK
jgi:hypothetical protein